MSATDGIKAGRAYVELSVKDKLSRGLARAKEQLAAWAQGLAAVGTGITGLSGSVLGGLVATVRQFADMGSELADMSAATGVSAATLSALGYAAKQAGVDLGALHAGLRGMAKFTAQVAAGNKSAIATLNKLGISAAAFLSASPEDRLAMLADGLKTIPDPGLRAALAMKTLGKSGEALLPMLAEGSDGLNAFIDRAQELGIVITDEEAQKADALGDAWDDLLSVLGAIAFRTGAALASTMQAILETVTLGAVAVSDFVRNNQGLVVVMAAAALSGMALGGVLLTLASLSATLSLVMGGLNAVIALASTAWAVLGAIKTAVAAVNAWLTATLTAEGLAALWAAIQTSLLSAAMTVLQVVTAGAAAALSFITTPLGLIVLALAAVASGLALGAVLFFGYTEAGQYAVSTLTDLLTGLWRTATQTFQGIFDAMVAGRWDLAAAVAMAGLNVAWQRGVFALKSLWSGFKEWLIGLFADMFASIFRRLADFQVTLVGGINVIREKLGMSKIEGFAGIDKLAAREERRAEGIKLFAAAARDAEMAKAQAAVDQAQKQLDEATKAAADARQEQSDKRKRSVTGLLDQLAFSPNLEVTAPAASVAGSFNAVVKGLLTQSAETAQERTAQASEAMQDHLAAIRRQVEEGLLEASE